MKLSEIADRLEARLGDTAETVWAGRKYIYIRFAGDMAEERLTETQAQTYLSWLRTGHVGTWHEFVNCGAVA